MSCGRVGSSLSTEMVLERLVGKGKGEKNVIKVRKREMTVSSSSSRRMHPVHETRHFWDLLAHAGLVDASLHFVSPPLSSTAQIFHVTVLVALLCSSQMLTSKKDICRANSPFNSQFIFFFLLITHQKEKYGPKRQDTLAHHRPSTSEKTNKKNSI
jgi:hypothetical protein